MLVGYARVSTDLQTTDGKIDALHAAGCERVFEESMSGTRANRPQLAAALEYAREGDVLAVSRLDRLARSMRQLLTTVDALQARKAMLTSGTMTASEVARQIGCSPSMLYRHVPGGRTAIAESAISAAALTASGDVWHY